jgi:hypothetical protein
MERDDDKTPPRRQHPFRGMQRIQQFRQFVVHEDSQALERARRRMYLAGFTAHDPPDDIGERRGSPNGCFGAMRDDRTGDRAGMALFAQGADNGGKVARRRALHHVSRRGPVATHAHVERPVVAEREAAFRLIELHR